MEEQKRAPAASQPPKRAPEDLKQEEDPEEFEKKVEVQLKEKREEMLAMK
eukprot:CAMPEP_0185578662 /NCGR_PEP_ID=MMETSP0434-20130131/13072_1 /TAXON_ID=626734 ORGANISM="Favella taraikaensis, Strain Fe Narragansett Bay" /NCGR_SAMPLE_ID=MMETSP0434 /ASSEMBLY_ACC=CAM_ASM_000379 /LENGTH=49 /DNA_ID=CAMNT_0028196517 /DNA_START=631 /DNA_END=780 /DNA_ORIENTATION=-